MSQVESCVDSFEVFRQEIRDALPHLHSPDYQPSRLVCTIVGGDLCAGAGRVQDEILRMIQDLKPCPDMPPGALPQRDYDLLYHRFVLKLTQEETAERLSTSVRSMVRAQRAATHRLARLLWDRSLAREASSPGNGLSREAPADDRAAQGSQAPDWRSQVRQDLASLERTTPGCVADVEAAIRSAMDLESMLTSERGVWLQVGNVQPNLLVAMHPSALRQLLIMVIAQLASGASSSSIILRATLDGQRVRIIFSSTAPAKTGLPDADLIREILTSQGGSLDVQSDDRGLVVCLGVPAAGEVNVLVVDDNEDSVHYYRRCTARTRYHITHSLQGQGVIQAIEATRPDIIVLDIMLPDIDGWDLLAHLHRDPATRSIPIIVCSIVREEKLASALGAALYLPKPVRRREFIQALDRTMNRVPT